MSNVMRCLECGNNKKFIIPYIDRTLTTFNEHGDIESEESVSYWSYDDERIVCSFCNSDNLNIYKEN
jgi:hypothetical protein